MLSDRLNCTAPQRVVELLKRVAANHPGVAKQPQPQSYVLNFSSGAVTFSTPSLNESL
jgi:small-conductance mechanosensitive channel